MTSFLPIPATSAFSTSSASINGRSTPAEDAARFLEKLNSGHRDEAMQLFASLMGVDDPDKIPPIDPHDSTSYEAAFLTQMGAQLHMREWAMTTLPQMLGEIKVK